MPKDGLPGVNSLDNMSYHVAMGLIFMNQALQEVWTQIQALIRWKIYLKHRLKN